MRPHHIFCAAVKPRRFFLLRSKRESDHLHYAPVCV